jgi:hypothetical protein
MVGFLLESTGNITVGVKSIASPILGQRILMFRIRVGDQTVLGADPR